MCTYSFFMFCIIPPDLGCCGLHVLCQLLPSYHGNLDLNISSVEVPERTCYEQYYHLSKLCITASNGVTWESPTSSSSLTSTSDECKVIHAVLLSLNHCNSFSRYRASLADTERRQSEDRWLAHLATCLSDTLATFSSKVKGPVAHESTR